MAHPEHEPGHEQAPAAVPVPAPDRRSRHRKRAAAGLAGLAVLGGAAFLVTQQMTDDDTVVRDTGALAPLSPTSGDPATPAATASAAPSASAAQKPAAVKPTASPSPSKSLTVEERVAKARAAASKAGYPVQRGLVQTQGDATAAGPVSVRNTGSLQSGGTLRIVSARHDLTGQREQAWAADEGKKVGDARCTQNFHFSNNGTPKERPTMLLCWRTSQGKSVLTVAVVKEGRPDATKTVAALAEEWDKLG